MNQENSSATPEHKQKIKAQRKALMKPFEVLSIAAVSGGFVLVVVLVAVKDLVLGLTFAGIVVVIVLVVMSLLLLNYKPNPDVPVYLDRYLYKPDEKNANGASAAQFDGTSEAEQTVKDQESGHDTRAEE